MIPVILLGSLALRFCFWKPEREPQETRRKMSMAKPIPIGARGEARETVEFKHTLTASHAELPPVYSTPDMIRLMETAAFYALQSYCEGDEITVGTSINIQHRAASGIGAQIQAEAVLESFDGRFYTLRVTARDDVQEIGRGTVGRAVVSVGKLVEKTKGKQAAAE
jgi:fluoroacetyl-CoA thioesterase